MVCLLFFNSVSLLLSVMQLQNQGATISADPNIRTSSKHTGHLLPETRTSPGLSTSVTIITHFLLALVTRTNLSQMGRPIITMITSMTHSSSSNSFNNSFSWNSKSSSIKQSKHILCAPSRILDSPHLSQGSYSSMN